MQKTNRYKNKVANVLVSMNCIAPRAVGGVEIASYSLIEGLLYCGARVTVVGECDVNIEEGVYMRLKKLGAKFINPSVRGRFFSDIALPLYAKGCYDLTIFPNYFSNIALPGRFGRVCVIVHDLQYKRHPSYFSLAKKVWLEIVYRCTSRSKNTIVCISEFTRREWFKAFPGDEKRGSIECIPNPITLSRFECAAPQKGDISLARRMVSSRFLLCVANRFKHKNIDTLVQGYHLSAAASIGVDLILVGKPMGAGVIQTLKETETAEGFEIEVPTVVERGLSETIEEKNGRVYELGYVSDWLLKKLMRRSEYLVIPSKYEGFGLPAVEGLALGAKVLLSNIDAFREVAGSEAIFVDDYNDPNSWARSINNCLKSTGSKPAHSVINKERIVQRFSPEGVGRAYLALLQTSEDSLEEDARE